MNVFARLFQTRNVRSSRWVHVGAVCSTSDVNHLRVRYVCLGNETEFVPGVDGAVRINDPRSTDGEATYDGNGARKGRQGIV